MLDVSEKFLFGFRKPRLQNILKVTWVKINCKLRNFLPILIQFFICIAWLTTAYLLHTNRISTPVNQKWKIIKWRHHLSVQRNEACVPLIISNDFFLRIVRPNIEIMLVRVTEFLNYQVTFTNSKICLRLARIPHLVVHFWLNMAATVAFASSRILSVWCRLKLEEEGEIY